MEKSDQLKQREKLLRETFTAAEHQIYFLIVFTCATTAWIGDPHSYWLCGLMLVAGGVTPYIIRTHQISHPFFIHKLWKRVLQLCAPVFALVGLFCMGLLQDPIRNEIFVDRHYNVFQNTSAWWPTTTQPTQTWLPFLVICAAYLIAAPLFIVPKSHRFFERLFPWLCGIPISVAIYGFIQKGLALLSPPLTNGTGERDFFAFFPYDGHWAGFATLWMCACISMAIHEAQKQPTDSSFVVSKSPVYLAGGITLGGSALFLNTPTPAGILLISTSIMLLLFTTEFMNKSSDPHRKSISLITGSVATVGLSIGIGKLLHTPTFSVEQKILIETTFGLFREKPIFGWGYDSFSHISPFYVSDFIHQAHYIRLGSDIFQLLAEVGILGLLIPIAIAAVLLIRYRFASGSVPFSNHLMIGCASALVLAAVDTPLMAPSIVFSFLTLFFIALRWADLANFREDEVDTRDLLSFTSKSTNQKTHRKK